MLPNTERTGRIPALRKECNALTANPVLLQKKYARIIAQFSKRENLSLDAALNFFYHSETYPLISEGVSDLHCMSDDYLTEELVLEYREKHPYPLY